MTNTLSTLIRGKYRWSKRDDTLSFLEEDRLRLMNEKNNPNNSFSVDFLFKYWHMVVFLMKSEN